MRRCTKGVIALMCTPTLFQFLPDGFIAPITISSPQAPELFVQWMCVCVCVLSLCVTQSSVLSPKYQKGIYH